MMRDLDAAVRTDIAAYAGPAMAEAAVGGPAPARRAGAAHGAGNAQPPGRGDLSVRVFIGDKELTDLVDLRGRGQRRGQGPTGPCR